MFAAAQAASHPAWPAPMTKTSYLKVIMDCLFVPAKLQKVSELTDMNGYNRRFSVHNCPNAHPKW